MSWTDPDNGMAEIDGHAVTITRHGTQETITCSAGQMGSSSVELLEGGQCTATGAPSTMYDVSVTAVNAAGASDPDTATVTVGAVPAQPTVTHEISGTMVTFSWAGASPSVDAPQPLGHRVTVTRTDVEPDAAAPCVGPKDGELYTGTSCDVGGVPGGVYVASVVAVNGVGDSTAGTDTATVPAVAAPAGVTVTPGDTTAAVAWTPVPADTGVTGYRVVATPESGSPVTHDVSGATASGHTFTGLTNGTTYAVTVRALVPAGTASPSAAVPVTPAALTPVPATEPVPTAPGNLTSTEGVRFPQAGEDTVLVGTGFAPNTLVRLVVYSDPVPLGTAVTNALGTFSQAVSIPAGLSGAHTFVSIGLDPDGNVRILSLDVTVGAAARAAGGTDDVGLAITGAPVGATALLGVVLMVAGAASRFAGRPRRRAGS